MQQEIEITFRNMDRSEPLEQQIRARAAKLEEFCDEITSCHVILEAPHKHHRKGKIYDVRIELHVPGEEIVVSRNPGDNNAHEDAYVTVRDAFKAARRQLQDYTRKRRGDVKQHEATPHGQIRAVDGERGVGWIDDAAGRTYWFHGNSVLNASFDDLVPGTRVRFSEAGDIDDEGLRASTVYVEGKHHAMG